MQSGLQTRQKLNQLKTGCQFCFYSNAKEKLNANHLAACLTSYWHGSQKKDTQAPATAGTWQSCSAPVASHLKAVVSKLRFWVRKLIRHRPSKWCVHVTWRLQNESTSQSWKIAVQKPNCQQAFRAFCALQPIVFCWLSLTQVKDKSNLHKVDRAFHWRMSPAGFMQAVHLDKTEPCHRIIVLCIDPIELARGSETGNFAMTVVWLPSLAAWLFKQHLRAISDFKVLMQRRVQSK